jgi:hypothetical protein
VNEKANPSRGGDAKSWICLLDAQQQADRQTAVFLFRRFSILKEVITSEFNIIVLSQTFNTIFLKRRQDHA